MVRAHFHWRPRLVESRIRRQQKFDCREVRAPVPARMKWRETMLKSALLVSVGVIIGAEAISAIHAATGPGVYTVYEANVTDEAAYGESLARRGQAHKE